MEIKEGDTMLFYCWASIIDAEPILGQRNVLTADDL